MSEDSNSLIHANTWKPREKLLDRWACFQIFEESLHWDTSSFENPCAAEFPFNTLDFRAIAPIQHDVHVMLGFSIRQAAYTLDTELIYGSLLPKST